MAVNIIFYFGLKESALESQANEQGYTLGEYAGVAQNIVGTLMKKMFKYLRKMEV